MYANVKVTVLVDNYAAEGFEAEHGLAFWIEVVDGDGSIVKTILFDTGQSGHVLERNAEKCGIDLATADCLVLSHGHYDHTGGLKVVVNKKPTIKVYGHSKLDIERYSIKDKANPRAIDLPLEIQSVWKQLKERRQIEYTDDSVMLCDRIGITGFVKRETEYEDVGGPFYLDNKAQHDDLIEDDQSLWIRTNHGLVIVAGCSHAGIINTITQVKQVTNEERVHAVIGGFHLVNANEERMSKTIRSLRGIKILKLAACHCTGDEALMHLSKAFPENYVEVQAGRSFSF
ncbi:MBL fold metallo-hydrolase [Planctomycetota bacterium]|nr:MBL fold metallo-hydrolase [Planctomycetota bacterium]